MKRSTNHKKHRHVIVISLLILALVLTFRFKEILISWLIPGDDQVTIQTTESLLSDLRNGTPIGEALSVFCEEIIVHGE